MKDKLRVEIINGEFDKARETIRHLDFKTMSDVLTELSFDTRTICAYSFVYYLLQENNTAELQYLASELMSMALCHLEGAYNVALFHGRKAAQLSDDISYQEYLLFFYTLPEKLMSSDEARMIAKRVLDKDPQSRAALYTLELMERD